MAGPGHACSPQMAGHDTYLRHLLLAALCEGADAWFVNHCVASMIDVSRGARSRPAS